MWEENFDDLGPIKNVKLMIFGVELTVLGYILIETYVTNQEFLGIVSGDILGAFLVFSGLAAVVSGYID